MAQLEVYHIERATLFPERGEAFLEGDEAHHLLRVRRARPGDEIMLIDGLGTAWQATLQSAERDRATLRLGEHFEQWREPPVHIHLGLGMLKADRFGEAVNLAVQAGVGEITPLECRYSVAGWSPAKQQRAERLARTAAKQCGRGLIPPLHGEQPLRKWCIQQADFDHRWLLDPEGTAPPEAGSGERIALAIGPEGGFSDEEITMLRDAGFSSVSLGRRRLRSETATVVAIASILIPVETGTDRSGT